MKCLTMCQPWAWLTIHGTRDIHNCYRYLPYRGLILIHAGLEIDHLAVENLKRLNIALPKNYELGGIVGIANIVDMVRSFELKTNHWAQGDHWSIVFSERRPLPFVKHKGFERIFQVDESVLDRIRALGGVI